MSNAIFPIALGILGLLSALLVYIQVVKAPAGSGKVKEIGDEIHLGAMVFMAAEYKRLGIFCLICIAALYFSLGFFIGNNLIGIFYHKQNFFVLFLPEGVPIFIIPLLILIEYVSYISRIFSLAIRLFANMLSGHILLKILICFIWAIAISNVIHWFWILLPLSIVFAVIGLETAIAFLQAYVFLVLVSIYFNDVINTH